MLHDAIHTVRAALEPNATPDVKSQATGLLRALLAVIEPTTSPPVTSPGTPPDPAPAATATAGTAAPTSPAPDAFFDRLFDRLRAYLPEDVVDEMPRFRVPIVRPWR